MMRLARAASYGLLGVLGASATAQTDSSSSLEQKRQQADAVEKQLPAPALPVAQTGPISASQQERLQKYLPQTLRKLTQREPVHILFLGDASALEIREAGEKESFAGLFADKLANLFYYTGGVRPTGFTSQEIPFVTLRVLARNEGSVLDAAAIMESTAGQAPVDLVILCYGQGDAGMQPPAFARALSSAVSAGKAKGAEIMFCSPWLPVAEKTETALGQTRPLADIQRETAEELGILNVDLGSVGGLLDIPASTTPDEAQTFGQIDRLWKEFFYQDASGHFTPKASFHQRLGSLFMAEFLGREVSRPWIMGEATAAFAENGSMEVSYTLHNSSRYNQRFTTLPLISGGWKPEETRSVIEVKAGASETVSIRYAPAAGKPPALQEPVLRLPLLVNAGSHVRVETLRVVPEPLAIVWGQETMFNQEGAFLPACQIINTGKTPLQGSWQAEMGSQKQRGTLDLASQATTPLNLRFTLPEDSQTLPLTLVVQAGGKVFKQTRQIVMQRNLGLGQRVAMTLAGASAAPEPQAFVTAQAEKGRLLFTLDFPGNQFLESPQQEGTPAWQVELNLDARSYGKRLEAGSTATLRATGPATDGEGRVQPMPAWVFGTGYAATFAPKEFTASLSGGGERGRITLSLPRTYLYLHEWALDNGNSQFGVSLRLTLHTAEGYRIFALPLSAKPVNDIDSLTVLELTGKPTRRFTVSVE